MRLSSFAVAGVCAGLLLHAAPVFAQATPTAPGPAIAPPPPMDPSVPGGDPNAANTPEAQTTAQLNQAETEDSGRNFELFWIDAQAGGSYINMQQFSSTTLQIEKASSGGGMFSVGAGVRFVLFVAGVRVRYNVLSAFNLWQLNPEIGLKIPIGSLDFLVGVHGGYSFVGNLGDASLQNSSTAPTSADAVKIRGWNAGLDIALDYYLTKNFSLGVGFLADFLYLKRPAVTLPDGVTQAEVDADPNAANLYNHSGDSLGFQFVGALRVGGHFGL